MTWWLLRRPRYLWLLSQVLRVSMAYVAAALAAAPICSTQKCSSLACLAFWQVEPLLPRARVPWQAALEASEWALMPGLGQGLASQGQALPQLELRLVLMQASQVQPMPVREQIPS